LGGAAVFLPVFKDMCFVSFFFSSFFIFQRTYFNSSVVFVELSSFGSAGFFFPNFKI